MQARIINPNNSFHAFREGTLVTVGRLEAGDYDCTNVEDVVTAEAFYDGKSFAYLAGTLSQWVPKDQLQFI